ncbi:hypothetical protein HBB16_20905 [Pseudonocardia sp. MCCB 268]|nr:hypothetical protein [Pseudonocardia cytotoxica]
MFTRDDGVRHLRHRARRVAGPRPSSLTPPRSPPTAAPGGRRRPRRSSGRWTCSPPRSASDPAEVRKLNVVAPDKFLFKTKGGVEYDLASTR